MDNEEIFPEDILSLEIEDEEENLAKQLIDFVLKSNDLIFYDQFKAGFIAREGDGRKILKLSSREFKVWLQYIAWTKFKKKSAGSQIIEKVVSTLHGMALNEGEEIELHLRIANLDNTTLYDLGGKDGKAVKITKDGWEIINNPPIVFRRLPHQKEQVSPKSGGRLEEIFEFVPEPKQSGEKLLLLVWLVVSVLQGFPHPILAVHGPQGSRKTTLFKILKLLLDPSSIDTLTPQGEVKEFVQIASHHLFIPLDNMSHIADHFSDALCRAITGGGYSKRKLYTDDEDIIYQFRRIIGINGINQLISKPDLLERSLILGLEKPTVYKPDKELFIDLEKKLPELLGALFDTVVKTLQEFERISVEGIAELERYRMADFARWGIAATKALGHSTDEFVRALTANFASQHEEAIEASLTAQCIIKLMDGYIGEWSGTPSDLLIELVRMGEKLKIDTRHKPFPQSASWLWRKIMEVKTNLEALGIKVTKERSGQRNIRIVKEIENGDSADTGVQNVESVSWEDLGKIGQAELFDSKDSIDTIVGH